MQGEIRFTAEVLAEACQRLEADKERIQDELGMTENAGAAMTAHLGWDPDALDLLGSDECDAVFDVAGGPNDVDEETRLILSFWDGLLLGAIAADISWERSFGIVKEPA